MYKYDRRKGQGKKVFHIGRVLQGIFSNPPMRLFACVEIPQCRGQRLTGYEDQCTTMSSALSVPEPWALSSNLSRLVAQFQSQPDPALTTRFFFIFSTSREISSFEPSNWRYNAQGFSIKIA
jgi:hypothetical protein